jgi:type IV secretory pathway VirB10-like protein
MAAAPKPAPAAAPVGSAPKKQPAAPAEPPRDPNRPQTNPHFSRLEMEFFAQAERLQTPEAVDTFDDLFDENADKPGWFGIKRTSPLPPPPKGGNGKAGQGKGGKPGGNKPGSAKKR